VKSAGLATRVGSIAMHAAFWVKLVRVKLIMS